MAQDRPAGSTLIESPDPGPVRDRCGIPGFLEVLAHDLRTPLAAVRAYADLLVRYPDEAPETRRDFAQVIAAEAARMQALVQDVLEAARLERGRPVLRRDKVALAPLLEHLLSLFRPLARQKGVRLCAETEPDLGPVLGDALKFARRRVSVRLAAAPRRRILLEVEDDGPGIPVNERERIFDRYYQGAGAPCSRAGLGLGLCIAREIVLLHGGEIRAEAASPGGTAVRVFLPCAQASGPRG